MALEGTIKDFGLPDIFQLIGLQRKTGILTLRNDKETVTITFESGLVVMADSSSKRLEDRLGHVLVKQGKLPKEKLDDALQIQKATLQRLGHVLLTSNAISAKDLREALQVQVSQTVFRLFRWRDGDYHFAPTDSADYDRENFNPMSADFILMEGIRMVDEWPIIEKKIPSMDMVLRSVVDPAMIDVGEAEDGVDGMLGGPGEGKKLAAASSSKILLTPEEDRIFRRVDGTRTVQAIIDATGQGEFEVCRTLYDLLNRNIISTIGRGVASERATASMAGAGAASMGPGYAVVAVAVLLALLGGWFQARAPFGVSGLPALMESAYGRVQQWVSRARLERLDRALLAQRLATGFLPNTLRQLVDGGLVDPSYLSDSGGRPYHYALTDSGYLLTAVDEHGKVDPQLRIDRVLAKGPPQ